MIDTMLQGLSGLIEMLISLLAKIMTALISGVVSLSEYSDFVNAAAVVNGWVIVRDIANMFFIIVLLLIAFGTILGQEEYHYKKLLPKMLLLAVLVNFSRTIIGVMIDFAQVIMLTFVNGYKVAAAGNFANLFQITKLMQYKVDNCPDPEGLNQKAVFAASVLALAMVVISIVTITVILIILALRIVMLWLLTVLSPIAFLCGAFPQGQEYYAQWWKEFKSQVMVGPVLAFFLWLSLVSIGSGNASNQITRDGERLVPINPADGEVVVACSVVGSGSELISYVIGIMMLLTATQMAQQMGGVIAGAAGRAKNAAYKTLKFGAKTMAAPFAFGAAIGGRKLQRELLDRSTKVGKGGLGRVVKYIVAPTQSFAGLMKRGERLTEEARQRAFGAAQEDADSIFTRELKNIATFGLLGKGPAVTIPHQRLAEAAERDEYAKEYSHLNRTEFMAQAQSLMGRKGKEYEKRREALLAAAVPKGYNDDMMRNWADKYQKVGREKFGMQDGQWDNNIMRGEFNFDFLGGIDINKAAGTGRAHVLKNWRNEQGLFAALADQEDNALKTNHPENAFHQGPMETEGPDRGKWKGSYAQVFSPNNFKQAINMGLDGKEIEQRLMNDKLKFKEAFDAQGNFDTGKTGWYDTETGALALRKYSTAKAGLTRAEAVEKKNLAVVLGNSRQGDEMVAEVKKLGTEAAKLATHATTSLGNSRDLDGHGIEMTREQMQLADIQVVPGEERRVQERVVSQRHGDGAEIDPDHLVLTVKTEEAFLRMKTMGEFSPKHTLLTFARGGGGQLRSLLTAADRLTIKGPRNMEYTVHWKPEPVWGNEKMPTHQQLKAAGVFDRPIDKDALKEALGHLDSMTDEIDDQVAKSLKQGMDKMKEALKDVGIGNLGHLGGVMKKLSDQMDNLKEINARSIKSLLDGQSLTTKQIKKMFNELKESE